MPRRIIKPHRVVLDVGVAVPGQRAAGFGDQRIGRGEAAKLLLRSEVHTRRTCASKINLYNLDLTIKILKIQQMN